MERRGPLGGRRKSRRGRRLRQKTPTPLLRSLPSVHHQTTRTPPAPALQPHRPASCQSHLPPGATMTLVRFSPLPASALCSAAPGCRGFFLRAAGPARRLTAALAASDRVVVRSLSSPHRRKTRSARSSSVCRLAASLFARSESD